MAEQVTDSSLITAFSSMTLHEDVGDREAPYNGPDPFRMTRRLLTTKETFIGIARGAAGYFGIPQPDGSFFFHDGTNMLAEFTEMRDFIQNPSATAGEFIKTHRGIVYRVWGILRDNKPLMATLQQPWNMDPGDPTNIAALLETTIKNHYITSTSV